jgi:prevent-host-death family protein
MKVASLADVKARLSAYIEELPTKGPVVITRNGKTAAVLLAPEDDEDLERLLLARSPQFQAILNRSRRSIEEGKGLSRDEFWKTVKSRHRKAESKGSPERKGA